jgi:hypothetical protein
MSLNYLRADDHKQAVTHIWESRWIESMYTLQGKPNQRYTNKDSRKVYLEILGFWDDFLRILESWNNF